MGSFRRCSKTGQRGGCGDSRRFKRAAAPGPVQMGMPCGWGAPGPSPVMPVPGAHTPSFQLRYRVPQAQLSLAHAGEARGEDVTLAREDGPHGPHSLVGCKPLLGAGGTQGEVSPSCLPWGAGGPSNQFADLGMRGGGRDKRGPKYSAFWGPSLAPGLGEVWVRRAGGAHLSADAELLSALRG